MIRYENICTCGHEVIRDIPDHECPECGNWMKHFAFMECSCGEKVYLSRFTNECPECGTLYNSFGERLADPSEWDEEDRYGCFGPQNELG